MKNMPDSNAAWLLTVVGIAFLLLSIYIHWEMILTELGFKPVGPGGVEYLLAIIAGIPTLLLACLLLSIASLNSTFRSLFAFVPFLISIAGIVYWIIWFVLK